VDEFLYELDEQQQHAEHQADLDRREQPAAVEDQQFESVLEPLQDDFLLLRTICSRPPAGRVN